MYTKLDKALVALIMAAIGIGGAFWKPMNVSSETVATVVGVLTPLLVYAIPNLPKDS